jgi:hypothetical protein
MELSAVLTGSDDKRKYDTAIALAFMPATIGTWVGGAGRTATVIVPPGDVLRFAG